MKILLSLSFVFLSFAGLYGQPVKPGAGLTVQAKVDRRIELTSIVARLAEYDEYVRDDQKEYASDVDSYFGKYRAHPAIEFAKKVREANGIGFDAVPSLAVHLNTDLSQKLPFSATAPDSRWGKKDGEEFARLLGQFSKDTNFDTFFRSHAELYKTAETRMQAVIDKVDFAWYKTFYGEAPKGTFNLYIGLLNGGMNFGPKVVYPNGREELYAVIGAWKTDDKGLPVFTDEFLPTIIHEFNHSFVNAVFYENEALFAASGEKIFAPVAEQMNRQAYGNWKITLIESIVRAAVCRYLYDHQQPDKLGAELIEQRNRGFLWMDDLFVLFGAFENNRRAYPTFRSFLPMIAGYSTEIAAGLGVKIKKFEAGIPKVLSVETFANGAQDVDPATKEVTVVFDRPMSGKGRSINYSDLGKDHYPVKNGFRYSPDNMKVSIELDLKPDTEYGFVMTGLAFTTADGYPIKPYTIKFRTRK